MSLFFVFLSKFGLLISLMEIFVTFIIGFLLLSLNKKLFFEKNFTLFHFNKDIIEKNKRNVFLIFGSIFLLIPGYITDLLGFLMMLKFVQNTLLKALYYRFKIFDLKKQTVDMDQGEIIEGEFYDLHDIKRDISKEKK
jgi:UPF0716 family protein affecting phage T7 exclusion